MGVASIDDQASSIMSGSEHGTVRITIAFRKNKYDLEFADDATVRQLFDDIHDTFNIPIANQKILAPKGQLLKGPDKGAEIPLTNFEGKTLTVLGCTDAEVNAVTEISTLITKRNAARAAQRSRLQPFSRRSQARSADDAKYTFMQVKPLSGLPHPERSLKLLMKLKEDPGIRTAMRKHKLTVSLLTEMEPLSNTSSTHEGTSRLLGLNRNQGEVIELRLRTDAHDGYRDYKTIRKTLCHELAHNVHGPHDRKFWDLCNQIEREVHGADWKSGGHTIGESSRYAIMGTAGSEGDDHQDFGGWTGGEFVLGGHDGSSSSNGADHQQNAGMSRREVLAQAALERQRKEVSAERKACDALTKGWWPCKKTPPPDDTQPPKP